MIVKDGIKFTECRCVANLMFDFGLRRRLSVSPDNLKTVSLAISTIKVRGSLFGKTRFGHFMQQLSSSF